MKVQRVQIPGTGRRTWLVVGEDYLAISEIEEYLAYLEALERSPWTIRTYAYHLCVYWRYLESRKRDWTTMGHSDVAEFVMWLRQNAGEERGVRRGEGTIRAIVAVVGMFSRYHERLGVIRKNVFYRHGTRRYRIPAQLCAEGREGEVRGSRLLKQQTAKPVCETVTPEQVKELIEACVRLRDKFLLSLLYHTGMRIGQALGLQHADIHSWDNVLYVVPRSDNSNGARAKARERYRVDVSPHLMVQYREYLLEEFDEIESRYVFVNVWGGGIGEPMRYETVMALFERLRRKTGIVIHPHLFRHTHASELLRSGRDPVFVQERLGHASIKTTLSTYWHMSAEDLKGVYRNCLKEREK